MEKTYTITSGEVKETKTGKPVFNATLKDETGATYERVSIWGDFPFFSDLKVDLNVVGKLYTNDKGYITLYPPAPVKTHSSATGGGMGKQAEKLMATKASHIEKSQENKSESIKITTSMQLAVSCALAEYAKPNSLDSLETLIVKYRKFILKNWEVDVTDTPPFND